MAEPPNFPMDDGLLVFDADGIQLFIAIDGEGQVTGFNGHVDLGTGIRTALSQIVAEELDVAFGQVRMLLGSTAHGPNQGATIASETIQVTALPLRRAAATARHYLLRLAAQRLGVPADAVSIRDGSFGAAGAGTILLRDLVAGGQTNLRTDPNAPLKSVDEYTIVGRSQARVDIPAKATGRWAYVHDLRLPGMLHGRVVRPPYAGFDIGPHVGHSLLSVDRSSVAGIAGLVDIVVIGDFVGVIAEREENAVLAGERLRCLWRPPPSVPDLNAPEEALRANQSTARLLADRGDVERALTTAALPMDRSYIWPYQMHGSIGPSCAVADCRPDGVTIWSGTQNPFSLRGDIAMLQRATQPALQP
jgi:nicotinate dehydrogenase subunit B